MPFRLIATIIIAIICLLFTAVNLKNSCDISFVFAKFENVPVFLTILISFLAGIVVMLPLSFRRKERDPEPKPKKSIFSWKKKDEISKAEGEGPAENPDAESQAGK